MNRSTSGMKIIGYSLILFYAISFTVFAQTYLFMDFQANATILTFLFGIMLVGSIGTARFQNWGRNLLVFSNGVTALYLTYLFLTVGGYEMIAYALMCFVVLLYLGLPRVKSYFVMGGERPAWHSILVIDDDETILKTVRPMLISKGYAVLTATTGEEGLRIAQSQKPHLILLDVILPGVKGRDVCKRLKEDKSTRHIPVVFMTSKDSADDVLAEIEAGGETHLTKPVDGRTIVATIEKILGRRP